MRLKDKVAIVTGGAAGIGREISRRFAEEGAAVVIAQRTVETAEALVEEIKQKGGKATFIKTDVSSEEDTTELARRTVEEYGKIDILLNNAAGGIPNYALKPFWEITVPEWDTVMAINLRGMWLCAKAVSPYMIERGYGKIINTSSSAADEGVPGFVHYITTKAGIRGLTRGLASELGEHNITVNCIAYGPVFTDTSEAVFFLADEQEQIMQRQCIKRRPVSEELMGTLIFLSTPDSDFVTGQTIHPNGGIYFY